MQPVLHATSPRSHWLASGIFVLVASTTVSVGWGSPTLTRGTPRTLTGPLGTVDVHDKVDTYFIDHYVDSTGGFHVLPPPAAIESLRVDYDVFNQPASQSIFRFRIEVPADVTVLAAGHPQGFFRDGPPAFLDYWHNPAYPVDVPVRFDAGFGLYQHGSREWQIEYAPGYIEWQHFGNGLFPDTATGQTDFGFGETFRIYFKPGTDLGFKPATAVGHFNSSSGLVLTATGSVAGFASDLNGDGSRDGADAGMMFANWGGKGLGDVHGDGIVDGADAGTLFAEWSGDPHPSTVASVPEPACPVALALMAGSAIYRWRRRQ